MRVTLKEWCNHQGPVSHRTQASHGRCVDRKGNVHLVREDDVPRLIYPGLVFEMRRFKRAPDIREQLADVGLKAVVESRTGNLLVEYGDKRLTCECHRDDTYRKFYIRAYGCSNACSNLSAALNALLGRWKEWCLAGHVYMTRLRYSTRSRQLYASFEWDNGDLAAGFDRDLIGLVQAFHADEVALPVLLDYLMERYSDKLPESFHDACLLENTITPLAVASRVFDVLINHAQARPILRGEFLAWWQGPGVEFRFSGALGSGGKFWRMPGAWRVNGYREDDGVLHRSIVAQTNRALILLQDRVEGKS